MLSAQYLRQATVCWYRSDEQVAAMAAALEGTKVDEVRVRRLSVPPSGMSS